MQLPDATYRLQFNPAFTFGNAQTIVPYLSDLNISTIYASPIFKAQPGSMHGYDMVDANELNPELGDRAAFDALCSHIAHYHLTWLQDIVPNHMAFSPHNNLLMDVLENGENSAYYGFFDIDWNHYYEGIRGRLLTPFLGKFYAEALEAGEIQLKYDDQGLGVHYYEFRFPLTLASYVTVFKHNIGEFEHRVGLNSPLLIRYLGCLHLLESLACGAGHSGEAGQIHHAKKMLRTLYDSEETIRQFMDMNIAVFNGTQGEPDSYNLLDELLCGQRFRLSFWKVASEEINYRRFFSINHLISLKMEDKKVFDFMHTMLFKFIEEKKIHGIRIDHIDGLCDPQVYLDRLREQVPTTYVTAEKILDYGEPLPQTWPIQGTTGYEFMNYVNGLFCDRRTKNDFIKIYYKFTGLHMSYEDLVAKKKRIIIGKHMAGNIDNLAHMIKKIAANDRYGRDTTLYSLRRALVDVMAFFPVYRTYVNHDHFTEQDKEYIKQAVAKARIKSPDIEYELNFIEKFLLLDYTSAGNNDIHEALLAFIMRFQQFSGPLMAKGFEDTALYIYNKLISLNEVGGNPNRFGVKIDEFHAFNSDRMTHWPHTINATATHDMKRGEDVRVRINVLSELPSDWAYLLKLWSRYNRGKKTLSAGRLMPDENDEYLLYQTLIGTLPFSCEIDDDYRSRIKEYIVKAVREAKVHTAWLKPDTEYEEACTVFVDSILTPSERNKFLPEFVPFQQRVAWYGMFNSLSQTLLKITSPGIPDFYQGTELWDLSLVDPDNRRPVDFEQREAYLKEIKYRERSELQNLILDLLAHPENGKIKLFVIHRALDARRTYRNIFLDGSYLPLKTFGENDISVIAFAREYENKRIITVVPRFLTALIKEGTHPMGTAVWGDTSVHVPDTLFGRWRNLLTDETFEVTDNAVLAGNLFNSIPVGLFYCEA